MPLEHSTETYFVKRVEDAGGVALKGDVKGRRFIDRIAIFPCGITLYAELKRPSGGHRRAHQIETVERLQRMGHHAAFFKNKAEIDDWFDLLGTRQHSAALRGCSAGTWKGI